MHALHAWRIRPCEILYHITEWSQNLQKNDPYVSHLSSKFQVLLLAVLKLLSF